MSSSVASGAMLLPARSVARRGTYIRRRSAGAAKCLWRLEDGLQLELGGGIVRYRLGVESSPMVLPGRLAQRLQPASERATR